MIIGLMMAKNNSSRLENKNLLEIVDGVSLFEFSLRENLKYPWFDEFFVISNCKEIELICKKYPEVIFILEPKILAEQDDSFMVIKFLLRFTGLFDEDILVYVPTTAPLRQIKDIRSALALYEIDKWNDCNAVISVSKNREPPEWSFKVEEGYLQTKKFPMTSQQLQEYYHLNGAIYIASVKTLSKYDSFFTGGKIIPYVMPYDRSIDVDDDDDLKLVKHYLKLRGEKK